MVAGGGPGATHLPARSSKTIQKLVLLPDTAEKESDGFEGDEDGDDGPPMDDELMKRRDRTTATRGKSDAERLPKSQRQADAQLSRVTAYCTAQAYKLKATAEFVRDKSRGEDETVR